MFQRIIDNGKIEDNAHYEKVGNEVLKIDIEHTYPDNWEIVRLGNICRLTEGEKKTGIHPCLDAKFLRGKSSVSMQNSGKFVERGDNIILVDGENSGEVFSVPTSGYMGSTFKQLWISSEMYAPYVLNFIRFYKEQLRNTKKGAAIPHLNKEVFYNLIVGIPPIAEQKAIANKLKSLELILFQKIR